MAAGVRQRREPGRRDAVAAGRRRACADHLPGAGLGEIAAPVEVDVLARAESVAILQAPGGRARRRPTRTGWPPSWGTCRWPSRRRPGSWPRPAWRPAEYLGLLRTRAGQLLDQGVPGSYPRSLAAATRLIADRLGRRGPGRRRAGQLVRVPGPGADPGGPVHRRRRRAARRAGGPGGRSAGLAADPGPPGPAVAGPDRSARAADAPAHPGHPARPAHPRAGRRHPRADRGDPGRQQPRRPAESRHLARGGRG